MPLPYLDKVSKETGISMDKLEDYWNKAKEIALKDEMISNYAYVTGIFKKIANIKDKKFNEYFDSQED